LVLGTDLHGSFLFFYFRNLNLCFALGWRSFADGVPHAPFGYSFAHKIAVEDKTMRGTASDSFGFLPWVTILLTALVILAACYISSL
jgi:hypothetical protein